MEVAHHQGIKFILFKDYISFLKFPPFIFNRLSYESTKLRQFCWYFGIILHQPRVNDSEDALSNCWIIEQKAILQKTFFAQLQIEFSLLDTIFVISHDFPQLNFTDFAGCENHAKVFLWSTCGNHAKLYNISA